MTVYMSLRVCPFGFYECVCSGSFFFLQANYPLHSVSHCDWTVNTVACSVLENGASVMSHLNSLTARGGGAAL